MANAMMVPPAGFDDLPVDEQIDYVNFLWDRIFAGKRDASLPDWQAKILDERLAAHRANPDAQLWEEFETELRAELEHLRR